MRVIDCRQQTEEWDRWRARPTASEFHKCCSPAKGDYSTQATEYAAKIVAKRLGVYTETPPTFWMEYGTEMEPNAKAAYTLQTGRVITDVGFCLPDGTDAYGCSPDGLIGDDGGFETKCTKPETLIAYHAAGVFPIKYRPQVQGSLFITGRKWWDFYVFHPELTPFLIRVFPDLDYHAKLAANLLTLLQEIKLIESKVQRMDHKLVSLGATQDTVRFKDD
jgi:hypothetical protein